MAKFVCSICGYTHEGNVAPAKCPVCLSSASEFSEIQETIVVEDRDVFPNNANPNMDDIVNNETDKNREDYKTEDKESKVNEIDNFDSDPQIDKDCQLDIVEKEIIDQFNRTHGVLQVVKWYKETYNVGLKEAKDRVDTVLIKNNLINRNNGCMITILIAITTTLSFFCCF